jgi:hypothetical protein
MAYLASVASVDFEGRAGLWFQRDLRNDEKFRKKVTVLPQNGETCVVGRTGECQRGIEGFPDGPGLAQGLQRFGHTGAEA